MDIISLDQPTAATMTTMKGLLKVYSAQNNADGRYSEAIDRYNAIYRSLMNEVLGR
jgi:hypothetical protein